MQESNNNQPTPTVQINDVRSVLLDTIHRVREGSLNVDQAKTVADLARVIVETAKVEVDYLRVITDPEHRRSDGTGFIPAETKTLKQS
jgi:hypothetical protein